MLLTVLYSVTIGVSSYSNALVLWIVSTTKSLQNVNNFHIANLAVSSNLTMSMEFDKNFSNWLIKWLWHFFEHFWSKLLDPPNCNILAFKVIFLCQKLSQSFFRKILLENINLGAQLLWKLFFDNFILKKVLFLKRRHQMLIFVGLITSMENVQKNFNLILVISGVINSVQLKKIQIESSLLFNKKFRNHFHFSTWILPDYMAHDITKEFWKNTYFEKIPILKKYLFWKHDSWFSAEVSKLTILPLKWCFFRHEKIDVWTIICHGFWPN